MNTLEARIIHALQGWLGPEAVDAARFKTYCHLFRVIACFGPDAPVVAVEAALDDVKSVADGDARTQLGASNQILTRLQPILSRSRSRSNGLRRGTMGTALAAIAKRHGQPVSEAPRAIYKGGPQSYMREPFAQDFVAYLAICRQLAPIDVFTTSDIALRELSRVANTPSYWAPGRPASCADWTRRAQERDEALAVVASTVHVPLAFVAGQRYMALVTRLVRNAKVSIDVVVPRLWPGTSRPIREALEALADADTRGVRVRALFSNPGPDAGLRIQAVARFARTYLRSVTGHTLHESTVVIDGRHIVVGSQSWTPNAVHRGVELSTYMEAPSFAEVLSTRVDAFWYEALPGTEVAQP
jgi:phosphatidylserine/phosphatidylglycerophosphate/cardiolipin synthase-like enzyme